MRCRIRTTPCRPSLAYRDSEGMNPGETFDVSRACCCALSSCRSLLCSINSDRRRAQSPAPVENVSSLPPRTPEDERKALHVPPGFEIQLVAVRARHPQALEPGLRRSRAAVGDEHGRISLPGPRGHATARHGEDPLRLSGRRPGEKDRDVRRRLEYPDRSVAPAIGPSRARSQHPQHLPDARRRWRRPRRHSRGALWGLRQSRHARHDQRVFLGLRRLDLCLPWLFQRFRGAGQGPSADPHEIGQHLPDEAGRVACRVFHPRPGQSVRAGVRPAGQPLLGRLPQPAGLSAHPRGLVSQLRQAGRRRRVSGRTW